MLLWGVRVWMSVAMGCWGVDDCCNGYWGVDELQWGVGVWISVAIGCG